jgi:hypothetical protein
MAYGYLIVVQDNVSENYSYGIPDGDDAQSIFTSYEDAKIALEKASKQFNEFMPVAYGKAFPYDSVTFEQELEEKSFAPFGWGTRQMDDEIFRMCLGLLRMKMQ